MSMTATTTKLVEYRKEGGVAVLTLNDPHPETAEYFGISVAVRGNLVVVGAYGKDLLGVSDAGTAYLFNLGLPTPTVPVATLNNPSPAASAMYGVAAALADDFVVVGAYRDDTQNVDQGAAFVFDNGVSTNSPPVLDPIGNKSADE